MKRTSFILMAFALVMTLTQCKKNEKQPATNDNVVTITLNLNNNTVSKVDVNPAMGTVDFESGDKIYVGSGGKYVGFLTHNGTNFSGNITNPTENQPLQLYFLGNVTPQETLSAGTTEECSVIISDQTEHLPVISCAASNENYVSGVTAYSAHLLNKCALVKFNVTTPSNSPICITGMKNKVTVDFTQNTMTPSMDGEGVIKLPAGAGENVEKWAILLPQEVLGEGEEGSIHSIYGDYSGTRPEIPIIMNNGYYMEGINLFVTTSVFPEGATNGLFTINANGNQIYFSRGNLQYIGSANTPYWKFADNQWDYFGENGQEDNAVNQNLDRDLFGWGTSGFDHGAICYQPWSTNSHYNCYYAYGQYWYSLYELTGKADWGYNAIINGGNTAHTWRTPTKSEWDYVFNSRSTTSELRYVKAMVNNESGIILLPDDWNSSYYILNNANQSNASFNSNIIDASHWSILERHGAVFLPAAGSRDPLNGFYRNLGLYYSSSSYDDKYVYNLFFNSSSVLTQDNSEGRQVRCSVRLVQDYNP